MKYLELKKQHSDLINNFPMAFAFSNSQFEEAKKKLGVTENKDLYSIPGGGIIKKTDSQALADMYIKIDEETEEFLKVPEQLKEALVYELGNHEFGYTGDYEQTLDSLGLKYDELSKEQLETLEQARKEYLGGFER